MMEAGVDQESEDIGGEGRVRMRSGQLGQSWKDGGEEMTVGVDVLGFIS